MHTPSLSSIAIELSFSFVHVPWAILTAWISTSLQPCFPAVEKSEMSHASSWLVTLIKLHCSFS